MIDYVLFTRDHFRLLGSLDQISESWFAEKKVLGCPHVHIPSDHFALLVELELRPSTQLARSTAAAAAAARSRCRSEGATTTTAGGEKRVGGVKGGLSNKPNTDDSGSPSGGSGQKGAADPTGRDSAPLTTAASVEESSTAAGTGASGKHRKR